MKEIIGSVLITFRVASQLRVDTQLLVLKSLLKSSNTSQLLWCAMVNHKSETDFFLSLAVCVNYSTGSSALPRQPVSVKARSFKENNSQKFYISRIIRAPGLSAFLDSFMTVSKSPS